MLRYVHTMAWIANFCPKSMKPFFFHPILLVKWDSTCHIVDENSKNCNMIKWISIRFVLIQKAKMPDDFWIKMWNSNHSGTVNSWLYFLCNYIKLIFFILQCQTNSYHIWNCRLGRCTRKCQVPFSKKKWS